MSDQPERLRVPRTAEEVKHLIAYRPPWWEYLLFAGLLAQGKEALEPKWRDYEIGYVHPTGQSVDDLHAWAFLQSTMDAARVTAGNITRILSPQAQEPAFGPPGTPGNPVLIEHLAKRLISSYEDLLDRASQLRGTATSDNFTRLFELAATFTDTPLRQIRDFIDDVVDKFEAIPETIKNAAGQPTTLHLELLVSLNEEAQKEFSLETEKVARAMGLR